MARRILVTGGNAGIGLALCTQLVKDEGCFVYLCSRSPERGAAAVETIAASAPGCGDRLHLVELDVGSDASVAAAAEAVRAHLGDERLFGVVNNAGTGLAHGVSPETMVNVNYRGPKRVIDAFSPLLRPETGRIVNVSSGGGPGFVRGASRPAQLALTDPNVTEDQIEEVIRENAAAPGPMGGYGMTKACLNAYTVLLARTRPGLIVNACSPGYIDTAMTRGYGATKPPEEGTVSIKHLLFADLAGNGWYYGSDAVRSPLHFMRNPGEPEYDGVLPFR